MIELLQSHSMNSLCTAQDYRGFRISDIYPENNLYAASDVLQEEVLSLLDVLQLGDIVLKAASRLNLPINWIPSRLSEQNFDLEEPPTKASPWVGVLLNHLRIFHQRLETLGATDQRDINQVLN